MYFVRLIFFFIAKAYRNCTGNGTWLFIPELNSTWSDYRACVIINPGITVVPKLIEVRHTCRPFDQIEYRIVKGDKTIIIKVMIVLHRLFKIFESSPPPPHFQLASDTTGLVKLSII